MSISTDREKSCVPRGRTRTGAASATSTRTRRAAPGDADDADTDDADEARASSPDAPASVRSPSVRSSAIARRSPSANDEHSATKRARYKTRKEETRANAAASARSAAECSPRSNVSHDASTSFSASASGPLAPLVSAAARTTTRQGWFTGRRGSSTRRLPMDARNRIVEG